MPNSRIMTRMICLFCLFAYSVISNTIAFHQDTIAISRFQEVKILNLVNSPEKYEGKEISFSEQIKIINFNHTTKWYFLETDKGLNLRISSIDELNTGERAYFRGKCLLISMGFIQVYDLHIGNKNSTILSIPGIIVFIILFFTIFKFDWIRLSFVSRREDNT